MNETKDKRASTRDSLGVRDGRANEATRKDHRGVSPSEKQTASTTASRNREAPRRKEGLRARFQRFMTAAAFAESGETDTALEIAYAPVKPTKVLLAVGGVEASEEAVHFAANLCVRMDAGLDVLLIEGYRGVEGKEFINRQDRERAKKIQRLIRELGGNLVPVRTLTVAGPLEEEVHSYAKSNKDVAVIVFDSGRSWEKEPERAKWESVLQKLASTLAIPTITAVSKNPAGSG